MIRKEFVVVRIDAAPDGGPYVLVSLSDPKDLRGDPQASLGAKVMAFTSIEELMKNLNRALTNLPQQMTGGLTTSVKLDLMEYQDSGIRVGDKLVVEITKVEKEGV